MEWTTYPQGNPELWQALVKKELKIEDLTRFLDRQPLYTQAQAWFDPHFKQAALSHTWTGPVDFALIPELLGQGVADFILDPFLLDWSDAVLQRELTHAAPVLLAHPAARLWVCHPSAELPKGAFRVLTAHEVVARGAGDEHELGYLLNHLIDWARSDSRESIAVAITLGREFFHAIAKKRALKAITEAALRELGRVDLMTRITWLARPCWREFTAFDPANNILRNATSVAAGLIAGAGVIESLPYDLLVELPRAEAQRAQRLALTTQLVLQAESQLGEVSDPASGSFALESLTRALGEKSWSIMQEREAAPLSERETLHALQVEGAWSEVVKRYRTRRLVQTGVNDFANPLEVAQLKPRWLKRDHVRLARDFEELRLSLAQTKPKVALAVVGDYAQLQARLNFARNYFELLGLEVTDSAQGLELAAAKAWLTASKAPIHVWVAADDVHPSLVASGERCYLAGKTKIEQCHNIFVGQDTLAILEELVLWWKGRGA